MTTLLIMQFTAACCYYRLSPYFTPFCFNAPCQYILLNLRPLIFGLTPFGWLRSLTITPPPAPTHTAIHYETVIFDSRLFLFLPTSQKHNQSIKQGLSLFFTGPNIVMWIPILSTKVRVSSRCILPALVSWHIRPYYYDKIYHTQTYSRGDKSHVTVFVWRR